MKHAHWIQLGSVLCMAVCCVLLVQAQAVVPASDAQRLIDADAALLKDMLGKSETLGRKTARQATTTAALIAATADVAATGDAAKQMATIRDRALAVAQAIEKNDAAKAKELAGQLSSKLAADASADPKNTPWPKAVTFDHLMRSYSSDRVGGLGLEAKIEALLEEKGPFAGEKQKEILDIAFKSAVIAKVAEHYKPASDEGQGFNPQNWIKLSEDCRAKALALAEAAKSNGNVAAAAEKLSASCVACHDIFR